MLFSREETRFEWELNKVGQRHECCRLTIEMLNNFSEENYEFLRSTCSLTQWNQKKNNAWFQFYSFPWLIDVLPYLSISPEDIMAIRKSRFFKAGIDRWFTRKEIVTKTIHRCSWSENVMATRSSYSIAILTNAAPDNKTPSIIHSLADRFWE